MRHPRSLAAGLAVLAALAAPLLVGCVTDQGMLQMVADRPVDLDLRHVDTDRIEVKRDVVGRDLRVTSILLIPTFDGPRLERAVEDALVRGGGDLMVRTHVRSVDFWFLIGISSLEVEGDVVRLDASESPP